VKKSFIVAALCGLILSSSATALSAAESVPSRDSAGAEDARFRETDTRDIEKNLSGASGAPVVDAAPARPAPASGGMTFYVKEIRFSGNYTLTDEELLPLAAPVLNKSVSLAEIESVVTAMKALYRSRGFVAAFVYVPPQQVQDGLLKIEIMEGRLGEVKIAGEKYYSRNLLRKMFVSKPGDILRYEPLRRDLARMNGTGDLEAKAVLEPGSLPGTTDVVLNIKERNPFRLSGDVSNSGTRATGEFRYGVAASHHNLTGRWDRLDAGLQLGKGVTSYSGGYSAPIRYDRGTRAGYAYSHTDVDVGGTFAALRIEGKAETHRVYVSQPVWESERLDTDVVLGLDSKSAESKILGTLAGSDELRVPNAELNFKETDAGGVTYLSNRFNVGIADFLGSSNEVNFNASRLGTGGEFFSYRGTAVRLQKLPAQTLMSVRGTLQLSPDALTPTEQLAIGGAKSVRGYQEGEYLADHGGFVSVDFYVPMHFIPEGVKLPYAKEPLKKSLQGILFADAGTGSLRQPLTGEKKDRDLAGIGLGARAHLWDKFYARFEWAFPVGDRAFDRKDKVFYFTVSCEAF
jgi:hemolysin activation/secretion protein